MGSGNGIGVGLNEWNCCGLRLWYGDNEDSCYGVMLKLLQVVIVQA